MRRSGARSGASIVLLAVLLAGCGDAVQQDGAAPWTVPSSPAAGERWSERISVDRDSGVIAAPGFNELIDRASPGWAGAADTTAAELLGLNGPFDGRPEISLLQENSEDSEDGTVVTATLSRLGDDSVQAQRYRVVLTRGTDGLFRFGSGERTVKCHSGRGHQDFSVGLCS
ncbi:hypothetical protein [Actinoplanes sp. NBRC 101535]|uniref:hypothetical protein n=1 Tax=Actinoplanes sp. NBRC 101535 TaxID=3032196 RepID=UPI0024A53BD9|nr:hypothetical protein [Actinoplanes sp. NBRC 101535]GLY05290.1 hypothetical protein Acsp01_56690 [Actinoplanes sp. NBRC 101535]